MSPAATKTKKKIKKKPEDDDDPVVATYDVFLCPEVLEKLYLLQYVNRDRENDAPYTEEFGTKPLEVRMKPLSGYLEMDIPLPTDHMDKAKAARWGEAMNVAKEEGKGSTFGVSGGLVPPRGARTAAPRPAGGADRLDIDREDAGDALRNFDQALEEGKVLNHMTIGGNIKKHQPMEPNYMVGVFRENQLHLTKVDGIVQMRPQFHHVDARTQQLHNKEARNKAANAPPSEARNVTMVSKTTDVDEMDMLGVSRNLKLAEEEKWVNMKYHDENSTEAYDSYESRFFAPNMSGPDAPQLVSTLRSDQYLDTVSSSITASSSTSGSGAPSSGVGNVGRPRKK
ncbi:hypothetical protein K402DRAFT_363436 [Aulographum hederae CBS 113979]|uniref:Uncharacterized protein n=1 Tax=Aulographum hederae CBS 113979 TaxID=1176131 RepID=A0A6G1GN25_9PEZI|nr:hypothetical protein K402DRAFT_363436 [Aulographum hederae CBS 113979]